MSLTDEVLKGLLPLEVEFTDDDWMESDDRELARGSAEDALRRIREAIVEHGYDALGPIETILDEWENQ